MWNTIVTRLLKTFYGDPYGDTQLHSAIRSFKGDIGFIKSLLEKDNRQINVRNSKDLTPLHLAVQHEKCSDHLINLLLEYGADVKATTARDGNTALHWLAKGDMIEDGSIIVNGVLCVSGSYRIAKILLDHGSDGNARNLDGDTPLHLAVQRERSMMLVKLLLDHGSDVNAVNNVGDTPLHLNVKNQAYCLDEFLDKITDVNVVNSKGETPLHLAVRREKAALVFDIKKLLDRGADVDKKDAMSENAYEAYCNAMDKTNRRVDPMLRILLQAKEQQHMDSSLHVACLFLKVDSVHKLLKMGADANALDEFGYLPLSCVFIATGPDVDRYSIVKLLLDYGADINRIFDYCLPLQKDSNLKNYLPTFLLHVASPISTVPQDKIIMLEIFYKHIAKLVTLYEKQVEKGCHMKVLSEESYKYFHSYKSTARAITRKFTDGGYGYWQSCCSKELETMGETEIGESKVSFLDLLLADAKKTMIYVKNKELVEAFNDKKSTMFTIYQGMLEAKIDRAIERRKLIETAAVSLSSSLKFADPNDEFFERTLTYCSNKDLVNVIEAMERNEE